MLLIGAILSHLAVLGLLLRTSPRNANNGRGEYTALPVEEIDKSLSASLKDTFKVDLFKSLQFWLAAFVFAITTTMLSSWFIFFTANTKDSKGFPLSDISSFVSVFGVAKIIGNIACGLLGKCHPMVYIACMLLSVVIASVCYLIDPWMMSYWSIMAYVAVYGLAHSVMYSLQDVIIKDAIGMERLGSAFGWIALISGVFRGLLTFYPGK